MESPPHDPLRLWRELLALRLPNPVCPMCGGSDWRELDETNLVGAAAIGFACHNCGRYLRLHAREL